MIGAAYAITTEPNCGVVVLPGPLLKDFVPAHAYIRTNLSDQSGASFRSKCPQVWRVPYPTIGGDCIRTALIPEGH
jgi:hypothetical protein